MNRLKLSKLERPTALRAESTARNSETVPVGRS